MIDKVNIRRNMREKWEKVPFNRVGDPEFTRLYPRMDDDVATMKTTIAAVFNEGEIVSLVNYALYNLNYQREYHAKKRAKGKTA